MLIVAKKVRLAKEASKSLGVLSSAQKDQALEAMACALESNMSQIIEENQIDVRIAKENKRSKALIDRLVLNENRVKAMAQGLRVIKSLPDPVGEVISQWRRPNGLQIGQKRVPLGVVGIIYESRPNVTADAIGLCLKTGNAVVLRGSSEAIHSNKAIVKAMTEAAYSAGIPHGSVQLVEDTSRESVQELIKLNGLVDVVIPRGGAGLINTVVANATVPVIETGVGNCHVYVDGECNHDMAVDIVVNAKTQRPGVCNAAETLLVDKTIAAGILPRIVDKLKEMNVEIRGCEKTREIVPEVLPASSEDWSEEYLDYILAVKVVDGIDDAIDHINKYGSGHSEAIVTSNYFNAEKFLNYVDAAAVYVNTSTRFTDGFEYGFGAELGISTQKLHARGPMGLKELTTIKYIIRGQGQIRK
ncbi:MAG: glutamate-5-semialdehyde dehydrogenase [Clostridiales bacterium]|nr:glutamate-5-semialdehyde dehydrogenase [Clostridiales bacterium]